jgi:hypothetical protein
VIQRVEIENVWMELPRPVLDDLKNSKLSTHVKLGKAGLDGGCCGRKFILAARGI